MDSEFVNTYIEVLNRQLTDLNAKLNILETHKIMSEKVVAQLQQELEALRNENESLKAVAKPAKASKDDF